METIMLPVTLVTAGGAAFIACWLGARTGGARGKAKVSIGDGGDETLLRRMRAQANFVEYAPFIVMLIGLIEFSTGTSVWLWGVSAVFLIARVVHPLGMDGMRGGRMAGTFVTLLLLVGLGACAVALPLIARQAATIDPVEVAVPTG